MKLYKDRKYGLLWLNNYGYNSTNTITISNRTCINLAKCEQVKVEKVCAVYFGLSMASTDIHVYRNKEGLLTVMTPYHDSMGFGAEYVSILPGFPFKSVYGFSKNQEIYIVGQMEDDKWGVIRISHFFKQWPGVNGAGVFPIEVVPFSYDTKEAAIDRLGITFTPQEIMGTIDACSPYFGDLTQVPDNKNYFKN